MPVSLLEERPDFRFGHTGSVYVTVWFSELSSESLDALAKHHKMLSAKYGKITLVSVIVSATKAPDPQLREQLRTQSVELARSRHGNVIVVLARGLSAIIARSFLALLSLMSSETMKVPSTLEAAADEVRKLPGQDPATRDNTRLAADLVAFAALPRAK